MFHKLMKYSMLPVLALALVVGACDQVGEVTGPVASAPSLDEGGTPQGYTVIRESDASVGTVSGVIGAAGGKLVLGKHELWVPKDAVSEATTFTMDKPSDALRFKLTATRSVTNDVGSTGFAVPLKLVINFRYAIDTIDDPASLRVLWEKSDGSVEVQQTEIDTAGKRGIGYLNHFSDYVLAAP